MTIEPPEVRKLRRQVRTARRDRVIAGLEAVAASERDRALRAERNVRIAQAVIALQQDEIAAWRALAAGPGLCSVGVES